MDYLEADVARGVAWLDVQSPGWHKKVDLARFDCQDARRCPLAYTFGNYFTGLDKLMRMEARQCSDVTRMGFAGREHNPAWITLISHRQAADAAGDKIEGDIEIPVSKPPLVAV